MALIGYLVAFIGELSVDPLINCMSLLFVARLLLSICDTNLIDGQLHGSSCQSAVATNRNVFRRRKQ